MQIPLPYRTAFSLMAILGAASVAWGQVAAFSGDVASPGGSIPGFEESGPAFRAADEGTASPGSESAEYERPSAAPVGVPWEPASRSSAFPAEPTSAEPTNVRQGESIREDVGVPPALRAMRPHEESDLPTPKEKPAGRNGLFQLATLRTTWLAPGNGSDGLGVYDAEAWVVFGLPCPTPKSPLLISPGFGVHGFDGPTQPDVPAEVYDSYVEFRWLPQLTERFSLDLKATPGWYSDFHQNSGKAMKTTGYIAGIYAVSERLKLVCGLSYLDRSDVNFLPIGGVIWTPDDDTKLDLLVPKPCLARRVFRGDGVDAALEYWVYLAGELGGGEWAVRRADGANDMLTYRDYRVTLGVERRVLGGMKASAEVGYIFSRNLEYASDTPFDRPSDTLVLRSSLSY
jgi:hypothetical protein